MQLILFPFSQTLTCRKQVVPVSHRQQELVPKEAYLQSYPSATATGAERLGPRGNLLSYCSNRQVCLKYKQSGYRPLVIDEIFHCSLHVQGLSRLRPLPFQFRFVVKLVPAIMIVKFKDFHLARRSFNEMWLYALRQTLNSLAAERYDALAISLPIV